MKNPVKRSKKVLLLLYVHKKKKRIQYRINISNCGSHNNQHVHISCAMYYWFVSFDVKVATSKYLKITVVSAEYQYTKFFVMMKYLPYFYVLLSYSFQPQVEKAGPSCIWWYIHSNWHFILNVNKESVKLNKIQNSC